MNIPPIIRSLFVAVALGVIVYLVCILFGGLLGDLKVDFAKTIGDFLVRYAGVLGLLTVILVFFGGWYQGRGAA